MKRKNFPISKSLPDQIRIKGAGYEPSNGIYEWNPSTYRYEKNDEYKCFIEYLKMHGFWYIYGLTEDLDIYSSNISDTPVDAIFTVRHKQVEFEPSPKCSKVQWA